LGKWYQENVVMPPVTVAEAITRIERRIRHHAWLKEQAQERGDQPEVDWQSDRIWSCEYAIGRLRHQFPHPETSYLSDL
jgi:predicted nucleic acid-binding protein